MNEKEGNVKVGLYAGDFPLSNFIEWKEDCKKRFGDCYWIKVWNDHLLAKNSTLYSLLIEKIDELEKKIEVKEKSEEKKEVKTLGAG